MAVASKLSATCQIEHSVEELAHGPAGDEVYTPQPPALKQSEIRVDPPSTKE